MAVTPRHDEMVRAIAASLGTSPITRDDLPPFTGERLGSARSGAEATLADAETSLDEARTELESLASRRAQAADELERCSTELADREEQLQRLGARHDELTARVQQLRDDIEQGEQAHEALSARSDELLELRTRADDVTGRLGTPLVASRASALHEQLDELVEDLRAHLSGTAVDAVAAWTAELREGVAPLHASATELLDELAALDTELERIGGGDVSADPGVIAARDDLLACQATVAELERQASTGVLGERARTAIEQAHAERVELEAQGRKVDRARLERARTAEEEALAHVGFDSMLDFRIVMSSTGVGTLAGKRREVAAARLGQATARLDAELTRSRERSAELVRSGRQLRRRALAVAGVDAEADDDEAVRSVLRNWFDVPEQVHGALRDLRTAAEQVQRELGERRSTVESLRDQLISETLALDELDQSIESLRAAVGELGSTRDAATASLEELERSVTSAERRHELASAAATTAATEVERLHGIEYLDEDVADRRTSLVQLLRDRAALLLASMPDDEPGDGTTGVADDEADDKADDKADGGDGPAEADGTAAAARGLVLDDPLDDLRAEDTLAIYAALDAIDWGLPVVYVTSRTELLATASRKGGSLRCANGRRRVPRTRRWLGGSRDLLDAVTV